MQLPFHAFRQYLVDTYGGPVHRVPLDLGFGCPHRAPDGGGGCTFCPPDGARAAYLEPARGIEEQIAAGVRFARTRYGARRLMAYVQAFTGTFAPPEVQREMYRRVLDAFPFTALSIGTRPDCLPPPTLALLTELRRRLDLWVELGVQTAHDATLAAIRRGHDWRTSRRAIRELARRGIRVAAHVILGLPGEDVWHWQRTADALADLPLDGIKIHNLHVVRGAPLADQYAARPFHTLDEVEYGAALIAFLRRLPPRTAVMRINTDTPGDKLIAPRWTMSKGAFRDWVVREMGRQGVRQGDLFQNA